MSPVEPIDLGVSIILIACWSYDRHRITKKHMEEKKEIEAARRLNIEHFFTHEERKLTPKEIASLLSSTLRNKE